MAIANLYNRNLVINALSQTLGDPLSAVRAKSAESLGYIGSEISPGDRLREDVIHLLTGVLQDPEPHVRLSAIKAIGQIGSETAISHLIACLSDSDTSIRTATAETLSKIGTEKTLNYLLQLLGDADPAVRATAVKALGQTSLEDAIPPLVNALSDADPDVRLNAAEAIGKIGSHPFAKARQNLSELGNLDRLVASAKKDKPVVIILSYEQLSSLIETVDVLSDDEFMAQLQASIAQAKRGETITLNTALTELGWDELPD